MREISVAPRLKLMAETRSGQLSVAALIAAVALAVDVALLALLGQIMLALGLIPVYLLGMLLLMKANAIHLGRIEYLGMGMGLIVILASLVGVMSGLALSAMVGLGWLFAIAFGYALYRWNRAEVAMSVPVASVREVEEERAPHEGIEDRDALRQVDIFRNLNREQLAAVAAFGRVEHFHEGYILGVQGSQGDVLYAIFSGHVQLQTESQLGQLTVRIAGSGESLPLALLIGEGNLITSAIALSDLEAFVMPRARFFELCAERPDIGMALFQAIAGILGNRYGSTLRRMTAAMDRALQHSDIWANV